MNQGHCTYENEAREAATCACSVRNHQEPVFCNWRNGELESQVLCTQEIHKQPCFLSALCHVARWSYNHPCICEVVLPLPRSVVHTLFSLPFSSSSLVFSVTSCLIEITDDAVCNCFPCLDFFLVVTEITQIFDKGRGFDLQNLLQQQTPGVLVQVQD